MSTHLRSICRGRSASPVSAHRGPYGSLDVTTPLPVGNISDFDTRWDLIDNDTLPAYQQLLAEDPQQVRDMLTAPVGDRIEAARLSNNIDDILARLSDWDVDVEIGVR